MVDTQDHSTIEEVDVLDANYPLVIILKERAPGTYTHSRRVMEIIETLAIELDLDVKTLKIAALFHDIGKTINPKYFTENQEEEDKNPHDELEPWISMKIIASHVGDTVQILINDQNISRRVIEICSQHHGTTVVKSIFNKSNSKDQDKYRYKCSKPATIEAALLMICDQLEAKFNSLLQAGTLGSIEDFVDSSINDIIDDQQLDDVTLKLGDLRKVKTILRREFSSKNPKRVDYDKKKKKSEKDDEKED